MTGLIKNGFGLFAHSKKSGYGSPAGVVISPPPPPPPGTGGAFLFNLAAQSGLLVILEDI
jgi:hypothetical protein